MENGCQVNFTKNFIVFFINNGKLLKGKLAPSTGCWIPSGGKEYQHKTYEVFAGFKWWVPAKNGGFSSNSVLSGVAKNGDFVYVCRGNLNGALLPGKLHGYYCYVAANSCEHKLSTYEVLAQKCTNPKIVC